MAFPLDRTAKITVASVPLLFAAFSVSAGTIYNPDAKNGSKTREVPCHDLRQLNGNMRMTCDFAEALDGQPICDDGSENGGIVDINNDGITNGLDFAQIESSVLDHQAKTHGQCTKAWLRDLINSGSKAYTAEQLRSIAAQSTNTCIIYDALAMCTSK